MVMMGQIGIDEVALQTLRDNLYTLTNSVEECLMYRDTLIIQLVNIVYTAENDAKINQWVEEFWVAAEKVYTPNSYKWIKKEYAENGIVGNAFKAISEHS
jgi:hypothetical protein